MHVHGFAASTKSYTDATGLDINLFSSCVLTSHIAFRSNRKPSGPLGVCVLWNEVVFLLCLFVCLFVSSITQKLLG